MPVSAWWAPLCAAARRFPPDRNRHAHCRIAELTISCQFLLRCLPQRGRFCMNRMLSIHVLAGAVAVPLLAFAGPAAALTPSQFVVFGDSFVDAGVVWEFTGRVQPDAALGFWQGRFSDGPTWVDYLGYANLGAPTANFYAGNPAGTVPGAPGFSFTPGATNFAVGGARASGDAGMIPGLPTQVSLYSAYLAATGQLPDINTLFILNFGNNDVSAIQAAVGNPALQAQIATAYVTNMVNTVVGLAGFGAQHILVAGVPETICSDNLKAIVLRNKRGGEPEINPAFLAFADYYGTRVTPARVRRPKDKAAVEVAVNRHSPSGLPLDFKIA
ncbi:SGNH/GDSL hydrolase family protein [Sandaracinobacteroides hominis]|uniref:SGNH/GDSL hydrolase family protein n=1 Tax=Sandaracinobacteroides hominis TaxID=2780086 RepID=UPI0018F7B145|nr:SGNH/GDSL hydrolase family protein [Sandaracinobacteroides hominis]